MMIAFVLIAFIVGYSVVTYVMNKVEAGEGNSVRRNQASQDKDSTSDQDPDTER